MSPWFLSQQVIPHSADYSLPLRKHTHLYLGQLAIPHSGSVDYSFTPTIYTLLYLNQLATPHSADYSSTPRTNSHTNLSQQPPSHSADHPLFTQIQISHSYFSQQAMPHSVNFSLSQINHSRLAAGHTMREGSCRQNIARTLSWEWHRTKNLWLKWKEIDMKRMI